MKLPARLRHAAALLALPLLLSATGCGKKEKRGAGRKEKKFAVSRRYERGPCRLFLEVDRREITIAGRVRLVLRAEVGRGVDLKLPEFGDKLDRFSITDFRTPPPRAAAGGRMVYEREYTLEPFLSGEYEIGAITVRFRTPGDGKWHELVTEPVRVTVKSLLPGKGAGEELRDIAGPVSMPSRGRGRLLLLIPAALLLAGGAGLLAWHRWRGRSARSRPAESAFDLARRELAALVAEDLPGKGRVKEFYQRLSGVLRRYIENRFGLRAPERTTEEFLADLERDDRLAAGHKRLLRDFLAHCDLVKFAALQPGRDEIQGAFDACVRFLEETRAPAAEPGGGCAHEREGAP